MSLLCARNIHVTVDSQPLLDGVDADLHAGEMVGLIGPNGAGKTTLLRVLVKLLEPDIGAVSFEQTPLAQVSAERFARRCAYLAQGAPAHWPLRVDRVVALGRLPHMGWRRQLEADDRAAIDKALAAAEIEHLRARTVTTLSGGERMRVLLARIFAAQPQLILADEPIAALDPYQQLHVMELLREHAHGSGEQRAVLAVLHDLNLAARFCDRLILMAGGRIVCEGTPRRVLTAENLQRVYGVKARVIDCDRDFSIVLEGRG